MYGCWFVHVRCYKSEGRDSPDPSEFTRCHGLAPLVVHVRCYQYRSSNESALPPDVRRWLCPAVSAYFSTGLCPPVRVCPICQAVGRAQTRAKPNSCLALTAGQSYRLTSGGEAESLLESVFVAANVKCQRGKPVATSELCKSCLLIFKPR